MVSLLSLLNVFQMVLSVLLVAIILLQPKSEGLSLMGQSSENFGKFERRGPEKVLHIVTIVLGTLFILNASAYFLVA